MILKYIKDRIQTVGFIKKITETMKIVSASSFKKYEKLLFNSSKYLEILKDNILSLSYNYNIFFHKFFYTKKGSEVLLVVFGNDKSLCGSFNSRIVNRINILSKENYKFFFIGKKIYNIMYPKYKKDILGFSPFFLNKNTKLNIEQAFNLVSKINNLLKKQEISSCEILYSKFYSIMDHRINKVQLLPFVISQFNSSSIRYNFFEIDDNIEVITDLVLKKYLNAIIFNIYCNSIISENSARMIAMENANKNSNKKLQQLKLMYNKSRQDSITRELIEVISGAEGLK